MSMESIVSLIAPVEAKKKRKLKKYSEKEKAAAVLRVLKGEKKTHVAKSIGVTESTVRGWVSMWKEQRRLPGSGHRRSQEKTTEKKVKSPVAKEMIEVPTPTPPVVAEYLPSSSTPKKRIEKASATKSVAKKKREATSDAKVTRYDVAPISPVPTPKRKRPSTWRTSKRLLSQEVQRRQEELLSQPEVPFPYDFFGALNLMPVPGALTPPPTPEKVDDDA